MAVRLHRRREGGLAGLGLYLTWSTSVAYDHYETVPRIWGLTAVEDQNVGGAMMMLEQSRRAADRVRRAVRADADPVRGGRAAARAPRAGGGCLERAARAARGRAAGRAGRDGRRPGGRGRWRARCPARAGSARSASTRPERMRAEIAGARERTDRPVAANLLLPVRARGRTGRPRATADVVVTFWGRPRRRTAQAVAAPGRLGRRRRAPRSPRCRRRDRSGRRGGRSRTRDGAGARRCSTGCALRCPPGSRSCWPGGIADADDVARALEAGATPPCSARASC